MTLRRIRPIVGTMITCPKAMEDDVSTTVDIFCMDERRARAYGAPIVEVIYSVWTIGSDMQRRYVGETSGAYGSHASPGDIARSARHGRAYGFPSLIEASRDADERFGRSCPGGLELRRERVEVAL